MFLRHINIRYILEVLDTQQKNIEGLHISSKDLGTRLLFLFFIFGSKFLFEHDKMILFTYTLFRGIKCFSFSTYGWDLTDMHNFTLQHRRESFALCIIALLLCTYQLRRLCALELCRRSSSGGSLTILTTPTHLRSINKTLLLGNTGL